MAASEVTDREKILIADALVPAITQMGRISSAQIQCSNHGAMAYQFVKDTAAANNIGN